VAAAGWLAAADWEGERTARERAGVEAVEAPTVGSMAAACGPGTAGEVRRERGRSGAAVLGVPTVGSMAVAKG
jgi:hypothetical protein